MSPGGLRAVMLLSVLAALLTIGLKTTAYAVTGSVGLLSDALESGINLLAAVTAYLSLTYAHRPIDATHTYGHEKIEFFSSGLEGVLIAVAGGGTAWVAIDRLVHPAPLACAGSRRDTRHRSLGDQLSRWHAVAANRPAPAFDCA